MAAPPNDGVTVITGASGGIGAALARRVLAEGGRVVNLSDRPPAVPLGAMDRVRVRFPHTLSLAFEPTGAVVDRAEYAARRVHEKPELDVCAEFLTHVRGGAGPDPAEFAVLGEAVEGSRVRRAEHDDEGGLGLGRVVA